MLANVSFGMAVSDEKGQTAANNDVFSREQNGSEPYLVVEGHAVAPAPPERIADLAAAPDTRHANFATGAIALNFTAPRGAFSYAIRIWIPASRPRERSPGR